ncbi:MAG: hypothetical protein OEV25_06565, partial [Deltaproteobacteria bacterium]|nr:hypothetical protein [Deltaproteobacteria bacterium]
KPGRQFFSYQCLEVRGYSILAENNAVCKFRAISDQLSGVSFSPEQRGVLAAWWVSHDPDQDFLDGTN